MPAFDFCDRLNVVGGVDHNQPFAVGVPGPSRSDYPSDRVTDEVPFLRVRQCRRIEIAEVPEELLQRPFEIFGDLVNQRPARGDIVVVISITWPLPSNAAAAAAAPPPSSLRSRQRGFDAGRKKSHKLKCNACY